MPVVELVDETFVAADPAAAGQLVHDQSRWRSWWPDLDLTVFMDRGVDGIRWSATGERWIGSVEIWLEPVADGVLVHHYQRLDPVDGAAPVSPRAVARERARRAIAWKRHAFALKDALEGDRRPGTDVHPDGSSDPGDVPRMGG